jgi:hypothetical protein
MRLNDVRTAGDALEQFFYMITEPESQDHNQGPLPAGYILNQEPGFLDRIVAAVQIEFAAVCIAADRSGNAYLSGIDHGDG